MQSLLANVCGSPHAFLPAAGFLRCGLRAERQLRHFSFLSLAAFMASNMGRAQTVFADWTSISAVATGNIGSVTVQFSGGTVTEGVTDGSSTKFDHTYYSPALSLSDIVWFNGSEAGLSYTITFSSQVRNPTLHFASLASALAFGQTPTWENDDGRLHVAGNMVTGELNNDDWPSYTDANGTVIFFGDFASLSFTATVVSGVTGPDGIGLQIGATAIPEPATVWFASIGPLAAFLVSWKKWRRVWRQRVALLSLR
ncbi:MAG: hypothetical protein HY736_01435 [Verrucomicrobia bacterium]|nr:hypothetical protein [Verrucomicrobiota bacterium]